MLSKKKTKNRVSGQIFDELAAKNVKKSAKDYFIYFFTLMLSVCLFYSFNSISTQFASLGLADTLGYLAFASAALTAFSVMVCFIMGGLVVYANRFLLRRRKKEMGIYATLGMERRDLNRLLMKETMRIGVVSLVSGLVLGIFASQILALITARLAGISLSSYRFLISFKAILLSILFFGILFFVVHLFNVRELRKMSLLEMLDADRKNETVSTGNPGVDMLFAVISMALMLGGCGVLVIMSDKSLMGGVALGGLMLIIGTFFFFTAVLRTAVRVMKKNKHFYFRGLNMFTTSQFATRLKTEGRSIAMTSVLLFLALSLTIVGPGSGKFLMNGIEYAAPFGASISCVLDEGSTEGGEDPQVYLEREGFKIRDFSNQYETFLVYEDPDITAEFLTGNPQQSRKQVSSGGDDVSMPLNIIGVEDYNRLLVMQNMKPIQLSGHTYAISYAFPPIEETLNAFLRNPRTLNIGGAALTLAENGISHSAWQNKNVLLEQGTLIVPQNLTESLTPQSWFLNFNFPGNETDIHDALYDSWFRNAPDEFQIWVRQEAMISVTADNLLMTYLGIYLGVTFLITAGAVLALQQLSQSSDNARRYNLLKKLGASRKDMKKSLKKQLRVYFGLPLILAAIHTAMICSIVFRSFTGLSSAVILSIVGFSTLLVFAVYAMYFVTTYLGSRRILQL